jgi:hypothetical protein
MKKLYKTALLAMTLNAGLAQTAFWTPTTYKGAFAPAPTTMWTDTWTEWDPENKSYPAPTMTVSSNITTNTTWSTGQTILLQGTIFVKNNAVLTIQPGVIIMGDKGTLGSALVISKGAQIQAAGTASQPIVFTSNQPVGGRSIGDWGGLMLLGSAAINVAGGIANVEGLPVNSDSEYGGGSSPNNSDNSGTLQYVRIEFGGYPFQPNKEINGLTMGGVGKNTTIDHIQCSFVNDDGFEWFGGNVNCKYLVSFRNLDDDFDTDFGFSGYVQFGLIVRDPAIADSPSAGSTSEGFESDNDASGTSAAPLTSGVFSNITAIGPYRGNSAQTLAIGYERALRLRRNTNLKVFNSIFMDFKKGLHVDGTAADANAGSGALKFKYNLIATTSGVTPKTIVTTTANANVNTSWFATNMNDSMNTSSGVLVTPWNYTAPDYRPVGTNTLVTNGANFGDPAFIPGGIMGIADVATALKNIGLYPNPAEGHTSLVLSSDITFNISVAIYNVTGQLVGTPYLDQVIGKGVTSLPIDLDTIAPGIYFVNIQSKNTATTIKLVVNK